MQRVGGPGDTLLASFSGVLLVVGGSGISYGLAAAEELVRKTTEGASTVAVLDLVWCVRYSGELQCILCLETHRRLLTNGMQTASRQCSPSSPRSSRKPRQPGSSFK